MKKLRQIVCIAGAVILAGLYILTLIFSLTDSSQAKSWLSASLYSTFAIPIILYAFLLITKQFRNPGADPSDPGSAPDGDADSRKTDSSDGGRRP